jgi:hypothetical protein
MTTFLTRSILIVLLILPFIASAQTREKILSITDVITLPYPEDWSEIDRTRNSVDLVKPGKEKGAIDARIQITTETRRDHAEGLRRLGEIAAEEKEIPQFVVIAGWPALQRRRIAPLARTGEEIVRKPLAPLQQSVRVTIAVAAEETLVRLEGVLSPDADVKIADEIQGIGRGLKPKMNGNTQRSEEELDGLRRSLPKPTATEAPHAPEPPSRGPARERPPKEKTGAAVAVQPGVGELEVAVSNNGQNVVVAANSGYANSTNGGVNFTPRGGLSIAFPRDGDPSLAFGQSGAFYQSFIGYPNGGAGSGGVSGCTDSLTVSIDNGATYPFRSHAVVCPNTGAVCFPDQEHIAADPLNAGASGDQVYLTWRNFTPIGTPTTCNFGSGFPAPRIVCSNNGGTSWGTQVSVGSGDFPRISVGPDGSVYVVYLSGGNVMLNKFTSCNAGLAQVSSSFPVTVAPFTALPCPISGLDRCNVSDGNTLSSPTVAVDDLDTNHVYVAYATSTGTGNDNIVVVDSVNGGLTFPRTVTVNTAVTARRFMPWACTAGGVAYVSWYDRRNATSTANDLTRYFGASAAVKGGSLVAGPEVDISGVDDPQCANWPCGGARTPANCSTCPTGTVCPTSGNACPKYGDYNGAACGSGRRYNAWASATPPAGVTAPGPGINVYENTNLVPSDFFIRDWTVSATNHDLGPEPSTNPDFYTSSDVWNQRSSSTPASPVNDWVAGDPDASAGGPAGNNNFAFVRVSRRAAAAATAPAGTVPVTFLKADYGLGANYTTIASASLTFNATDLTKTLSPGAGWRLEAGASNHICLAAEINVLPDDPLIAPSLSGGAPGPNDPRITQDNNKAQRNLGSVALPGGSSGAAFYAIIHNPSAETRDMAVAYQVPEEALKRLPGTRVGIVGGPDADLRSSGQLVLKHMEPGEFRWLEFAFGTLEGAEGDLLPISASEVEGETPVNGFTVGIRPSSPKIALREALDRQQAVLSRFAIVLKQPRVAQEAESARGLLRRRDLDESTMLSFLKKHIPTVIAFLKPHFQSAESPSPYHRVLSERFAVSSKALIDASYRSDVPALLGAHTAVFEQLDADLSMIQKEGGDPADILQMVRWQRVLFEKASKVASSREIVRVSQKFIEDFESKAVSLKDYPSLLAGLIPAFKAAAGELGDDELAHAGSRITASLKSPLGALEKAHRDYLRRLASRAAEEQAEFRRE